MSDLLQRRLLYVTGKGGVGRTTVCAALALGAAAAGRRTVVCEVGAQQRLPRLFGVRGGDGDAEVELRPGLAAVSIDPQAAMREWLVNQVPGPLVRLLADSRTFNYFYAAAPGARELVTMVKIWELTQERRWRKHAERYDLVIVDAPASGHGLGMLRTPRTFAEIARVGPVRNQADRVSEMLTDRRRTGFVAVASPADMPVNETLEFQGKLHGVLGRYPELDVVNGMYPRRFTKADIEKLAALDGTPVATAGRAAARSHAARVRVQQAQLARMRREAEGAVATLPYVFAPELDLGQVEGLAGLLMRQL